MKPEAALYPQSDKAPQDGFTLWRLALFAFVLAGATGAILRFGALFGLPAGLSFVNVRHAHSHLMYFGWVTPALITLMGTHIARWRGRRQNPFRWTATGAWALGLAAYLPFLLFGYQSMPVGEARIPLATIAASFNILVWYGFVGQYWRHRKGLAGKPALRLWDAAVVFLVFSSLGAWGRAVLVALKVESPFWSTALVHLFLDLFSNGWFALALLGLIYRDQIPMPSSLTWVTRAMIIGMPTTVLLGVPLNLVPPLWRTLAGVGGWLVGWALLAHTAYLWPRVAPRWHWPLSFLALKAIAELGVSVPLIARWAEGEALRIPYLHGFLLGFVTLGLLQSAREIWGTTAIGNWPLWIGSILVLLLSLIPLTGLWPQSWSGAWVPKSVAVATLGPLVAGTFALFHRAKST